MEIIPRVLNGQLVIGDSLALSFDLSFFLPLSVFLCLPLIVLFLLLALSPSFESYQSFLNTGCLPLLLTSVDHGLHEDCLD